MPVSLMVLLAFLFGLAAVSESRKLGRELAELDEMLERDDRQESDR